MQQERSNNNGLNQVLKNLLQEVLNKRGVIQNYNLQDLTIENIREIQDILSDEFCQTGLQNNDEPNKRGLLIEDLIDVVGKGSYKIVTEPESSPDQK